MSSNADRVRALVRENIEVDGEALDLQGDLSTSLADMGVSSLDIVALAKVISKEFDLEFSAEDCARINSLQVLVETLDSRAA